MLFITRRWSLTSHVIGASRMASMWIWLSSYQRNYVSVTIQPIHSYDYCVTRWQRTVFIFLMTSSLWNVFNWLPCGKLLQAVDEFIGLGQCIAFHVLNKSCYSHLFLFPGMLLQSCCTSSSSISLSIMRQLAEFLVTIQMCFHRDVMWRDWSFVSEQLPDSVSWKWEQSTLIQSKANPQIF